MISSHGSTCRRGLNYTEEGGIQLTSHWWEMCVPVFLATALPCCIEVLLEVSEFMVLSLFTMFSGILADISAVPMCSVLQFCICNLYLILLHLYKAIMYL